jgi:hypothetical protein
MSKRGNGLEPRIRQWFKDHPDSEFTYRQLCEQFGCNARYAKNVVFMLQTEGTLESVHVIRRFRGTPR